MVADVADLLGVADEESDVTNSHPDATLQSHHAGVQVRVGDQSDGGEAPTWPGAEAEVSHEITREILRILKKY